MKTMKFWSLCAAALLFGASSAVAAPLTATYSWEDGVGTVLGTFGNVADGSGSADAPTNTGATSIQYWTDATTQVTSPTVNPRTGSQMLYIAEETHSGTPQGYVAYVTGLTDGDTVDASIFGYDTTADSSPTLRLWGHYASSTDPLGSFEGSASGPGFPAGAGDANGWLESSHVWTFDSNGGARDTLVIEARMYSTPSTDGAKYSEYLADDLTVTVDAVGAAKIYLPDGSYVGVPEPASALLALLGVAGIGFRRR